MDKYILYRPLKKSILFPKVWLVGISKDLQSFTRYWFFLEDKIFVYAFWENLFKGKITLGGNHEEEVITVGDFLAQFPGEDVEEDIKVLRIVYLVVCWLLLGTVFCIDATTSSTSLAITCGILGLTGMLLSYVFILGKTKGIKKTLSIVPMVTSILFIAIKWLAMIK
jgi:hypothetical protein